MIEPSHQPLIETLSSRFFGVPECTVTRLPAFNNRVYCLDSERSLDSHDGDPKSKIVLKVAGHGLEASLKYERAVIDLLKQRGLPAPHVLDFNPGEDGDLTWMLTNYGGKGLHLFEPELGVPLIEQAGRMLARIHSETFESSGWFFGESHADVASMDWESLQNRVDLMATSGKISSATAEKLQTGLSQGCTPLPNEAVLCHGEFTYPHVLAIGDKVNFATDWPTATAGSSIFDLAIAETVYRVWSIDFDAFRRGYSDLRSLNIYDELKLPYLIANALLRIDTDNMSGERFDAFLNFLIALAN